MSQRASRIFCFWAAATLLAGCSQDLVQVPRFEDQPPMLGEVTPKFMATAVSFKAIDETGLTNWAGSDEVVVSFADFQQRKWGRGGRFGGVDAGNTRQFPASVRCIAPQGDCNLGSSSLQFGVIFFEEDGWVIPPLPVSFCPGTYTPPDAPPPTPQEFEAAFDSTEGDDCSGSVYISSDDIIGRTKVKLTRSELVALLPAVGASVDRTVRFTGAGGKYDFTYRLTRLADVGTPLVVAPPTTPAISLAASVSYATSPATVTLNWSGALGTRVDIYENGSKGTFANDGAANFSRGQGTYVFRVCNEGTNQCSTDATVTVTQ